MAHKSQQQSLKLLKPAQDHTAKIIHHLDLALN